MLNKELNILYEELISVLTSLSKKNINLNNQRIINIIDKIILLFNKEQGENIKIVHENIHIIKKTDANAFMFAYGDEIHYSPEMIIETKKEIIKKGKKHQNIKYNDITFALYIIDAIYHEFTHCIQYKQTINKKLTYQNYINQLSNILTCYNAIEYQERSFEGEAYGIGAKRIINFIKDEENIIDNSYKNIIASQLSEETFFKRNLDYHKLIYNLNLIPFFEKYHKFYDIITYTNKHITSQNHLIRKKIYKLFPITMTTGLNEDGSIKDPFTLLNTYFNHIVNYGNNMIRNDSKSTEELLNIYIYLLIPQLNPDTYNRLCNIFGYEKMDNYLQKTKIIINNNIKTFDTIRKYSLIGLSQIKDFSLLGKIDENYINKKVDTGINYMNNCLNIINTITFKNRRNHTKRLLN